MKLLVKATKILAKVVSNASWIGECTPPPSSNDVHSETGRRQDQGWYSTGRGWCPRGGQEASLGVGESDNRRGIRDAKRDLVWESEQMVSNGHAASDDEWVESFDRDKASEGAAAVVQRSQPRERAEGQGAPRR